MENTNTFEIECLEMGPHEATVLYSGAVTQPGALALERLLNRLFDYFKYQRVVLAIESPGGALDGLEFVLRSIAMWADRGRHVAVRSTFQCASAAAFLLAMGEWGQRRVDRGTSLLFHNARIDGASIAGLTAAFSTNISQALNSVDRKILDALVGKLLKESGGPAGLARLIESRLQFVDSNWRELALNINTICSSADMARKPDWTKPVQKLLRSGDDSAKFVQEFKKFLAIRFHQEQRMNLCEAFVLCLIDEVFGVLDAKQISIQQKLPQPKDSLIFTEVAINEVSELSPREGLHLGVRREGQATC